MVAWHALLAARPDLAGSWISGFPRNVLAGRVLAAVDVAWVVVLLLQSDFKWVENHVFLLVLSAPVSLLLIVLFVDDLLAVRALGGLFLLAPQAILDAALVHPSNIRLVMTFFAYVLVLLGIVWVWSPFMFRKMIVRWILSPPAARAAGLTGCALGLTMLLLGLLAY